MAQNGTHSIWLQVWNSLLPFRIVPIIYHKRELSQNESEMRGLRRPFSYPQYETETHALLHHSNLRQCFCVFIWPVSTISTLINPLCTKLEDIVYLPQWGSSHWLNIEPFVSTVQDSGTVYLYVSPCSGYQYRRTLPLVLTVSFVLHTHSALTCDWINTTNW